MDGGLICICGLLVFFGVPLLIYYSPWNQAELKARDPAHAAREAARKKAEEDRKIAEEQARWSQIERDFALSCVTQVNGLPCSGLAAPIRGTKDRYRCPVCGGQFVGAAHGF